MFLHVSSCLDNVWTSHRSIEKKSGSLGSRAQLESSSIRFGPDVGGAGYEQMLVLRTSHNSCQYGRCRVKMRPRCADLVVVLLMLTAAAALRPASSVATATDVEAEDGDYENPSFNDVSKKSKSSTAHGDAAAAAAELSNRIPVIFSELSDIERALSADASVTGSGELKVTGGEHAHSTTASGESNVRIAPKYMLDLYDKFSKDKYSYPMANIVRSFTNMNTGNKADTVI